MLHIENLPQSENGMLVSYRNLLNIAAYNMSHIKLLYTAHWHEQAPSGGNLIEWKAKMLFPDISTTPAELHNSSW